jgi:hypothetical protein
MGLGWPLLTGGYCSEVVVNPGLSVLHTVKLTLHIFKLEKCSKKFEKGDFTLKKTTILLLHYY